MDIILSRNADGRNKVLTTHSEIIMILPCRSPRGLIVYTLTGSSHLFKKNTSLKKCFDELERKSPDTFICVGRIGIVNRKNVTMVHDFLVPSLMKYSNKNLKLQNDG